MGYPSREEIKVLMDELLNAPEGCLPWEPIPARFSGSWQVDVIHVDEDYGEDRQPGENFTVAVAAYIPPTDTTPGDGGAWRIDFSSCAAYRSRIINYAGSAPLTRPDTHGAFWEFTGSHYLIESGVWSAHSEYRSQHHSDVLHLPGFRHFVIVSEIHTAHEVLARGWRCTPLPQEWAKTFTGPMPKWPPADP